MSVYSSIFAFDFSTMPKSLCLSSDILIDYFLSPEIDIWVLFSVCSRFFCDGQTLRSHNECLLFERWASITYRLYSTMHVVVFTMLVCDFVTLCCILFSFPSSNAAYPPLSVFCSNKNFVDIGCDSVVFVCFRVAIRVFALYISWNLYWKTPLSRWSKNRRHPKAKCRMLRGRRSKCIRNF
jgi:hypothetical protein